MGCVVNKQLKEMVYSYWQQKVVEQRLLSTIYCITRRGHLNGLPTVQHVYLGGIVAAGL